MKSTASLSTLLAFVFATAAVHATVTETFTHTYPLAADGVVNVDNVNGDIEITGWDKAEVSVVAEKRAKDDEEMKRIEIVVENSATRFSIRTKLAKHGGWSFFGGWHNNSSVRYKLMVPAGVKLDKIDSVNSDITVTGVRGSVNLDTVNGRIQATGLMSDARLDSVNGSLSAEFASVENAHEIKLDSVNGRAEVTLPKGASASIRTDSVNGSTSVDQPIKLSKSGRRSLAGEIGTGGPRITLDTVNGGIAIREK